MAMKGPQNFMEAVWGSGSYHVRPDDSRQPLTGSLAHRRQRPIMDSSVTAHALASHRLRSSQRCSFGYTQSNPPDNNASEKRPRRG